MTGKVRIGIVALCAALGVLLTHGWIDAAHAARKGPILSPHAGDRLPAQPTLIRVRTGPRPKLFRARLNGHPISRHFSGPSRRGVRRLRASATFGLRHGHNRLHVRVRPRHGGEDSRAVGFRVRRNRPLAAAGLDAGVAVKDKVYLGGKSRSHLRTIMTRARSDLRHNWSVIRSPRGSPRGGGLTNADGPRATFKPEAAGRYRLRLKVTAQDGQVGSDLVDVTANPTPLVRVDTMTEAQGGAPGIKVGDEPPYLAKTGTAANPPWFQVLVLDRTTLALRSNTTYLCDRASNGFCIDNREQCPADPGGLGCLQHDLNKLHDDVLVIAANHLSDPSWTAPGYVPFPRIGARSYRAENLPADGTASFSAIGAPGTNAGTGTWHLVTSRGAGGRINDWLMRNNDDNYVFAPTQYDQFTTQGVGSSATDSVIGVAGRTFTQSFSGAGGFHVAVVDARTLEGSSHWFQTDFLSPDQLKASLESMRSVINQANNADERQIVIVKSLGRPEVRTGQDTATGTNDQNWKMFEVVNEIERLGGTRNGFYKALTDLCGDCSYTLVSTSRAGGGAGTEQVAPRPSGPAPMNTTPISGVLTRTGPNYGFEPQNAAAIGEQAGDLQFRSPPATIELNQTMYQAPSNWPEQGHPGRTAAIKWIGQTVLGMSNFRAEYWTRALKAGQFDYTYFKIDLPNAVEALPYPGSGMDFTEDDLRWAKDELKLEMGWLVQTHTYLDQLATPFTQNVLKSWAEFERIATDVQQQVQVGQDKQTAASEKAFLQGLKSALSAAGPPGKAFKVAVSIYEVVLHFVTVGTKSATENFNVRAAELGKQFADRMEQGQEMLQIRIPRAIATDYEKLRTVASCSSSFAADRAACPFDPNEWRFTADDQAAAARGFVPGIRTWAYGSLMSAKYDLYRLQPWWRTKVGGTGAGTYTGTTFLVAWFPFDKSPASGQVAKPVYRNHPSYEHEIRQDNNGNPVNTQETWQIFALGYVDGEGVVGKRWEMRTPGANLTDQIFKPLNEGGLGQDKETFYDRYFFPVPLDHYPERDSRTAWCASVFAPSGTPACTGCPQTQSSCRGCAVNPSICDGDRREASGRTRDHVALQPSRP